MFGSLLCRVAQTLIQIAFAISVLLSAQAQAQSIVGTWTRPGLTMTFQADGRWTRTANDATRVAHCGAPETGGGTYTASAGGISLADEGGWCSTTYVFAPPQVQTGSYSISANTLVMHLQGSPDGPMDLTLSASAQVTTTFPIANTSGREMSLGAAFDGTNFLVGVQGDATAPQSTTAQFVSKTGALVGSRISTGATGGAPRVGYDGTNYLLVWDEDASVSTKIFGRFVSASGALVGAQFTVATGTNTQLHGPATVAFDGTNYFVVWDQAPTSNGCTDEYGQFVSPSGTLLGSPIKINTTPCGGAGVTVFYNGTNILAVWGSEWNPTGGRSVCWSDTSGPHCDLAAIWGQFITKSAAGTAGTPAGTNFSITQSNTRLGIPSIAYDGTGKYLVVFDKETTRPDACPAGGCKADVYGQLVSSTGALSGPMISVSTTAASHNFAQVVFGGTNYLVTWTDGFGTTSASLKGQYVTPLGTVEGSEFTLFSPTSSGVVPWFGRVFTGGGVSLAVTNLGVANATDPWNMKLYTSADVMGTMITLPTISVADCLFNWAERTYPNLFAPAGAVSATYAPYYYRYYSGTANYLATSSADNHVWVLGPASGNALLDVGPVASFLTPAGCSQ